MKRKVADVAELHEGKGHCVKAGDVKLVIVKWQGAIYALENKCPHLGLPLGKGKIEGGEIVCPFHGSRFDIKTGENTDWVGAVAGIKIPDWTSSLLSFGKKPQGVRTFPVTVEGEAVWVEC